MQPNNPNADKKVTPHPTSPWTEVFQPTTPQTEPTATERADAKRPATGSADSTRATHDALSVIFNKS
jgi:hypothetical protein